MRPTGTSEELEARRRQAMALKREGWRTRDVAKCLGVTDRTISVWWTAYQKKGEVALVAKPHPGGPSRLTVRQKQSLLKRLAKGARAEGFPTDLWTCPRMAEVIVRHYGVHYHVDHIPRLLASLGWSCQKPERRAVERDEPAIGRWVEKDWPRIKKR
jgi:transposase